MKPTVIISLSSDKPSHDWDFGRSALGVLYGQDPSLKPERVGRDDTEFRKKLPSDTVEDVRPLWATFDEYVDTANDVDGIPDELLSTLYWKRSRPLRARGSFTFAWYHKIYSKRMPSRLHLSADFAKRIDYEGMFMDWCALYEPRQAYVHYINKAVCDEARDLPDHTMPSGEMDRRKASFFQGFLGAIQDEKTYDLGCVNYFSRAWLGKGTVEELGEAGLDVSSFSSGVLLRLAPVLDDLETSFEAFRSRRSLAKDIIGPGRFEILG